MPLVSSGVEHGNLRELALARMKDLGTQVNHNVFKLMFLSFRTGCPLLRSLSQIFVFRNPGTLANSCGLKCGIIMIHLIEKLIDFYNVYFSSQA